MHNQKCLFLILFAESKCSGIDVTFYEGDETNADSSNPPVLALSIDGKSHDTYIYIYIFFF